MNEHWSDSAASPTPGRIYDVLLRAANDGESSPQARLYFAVDSDAPLRHLEYCFGNGFTRGVVPERRRRQFNTLTMWDAAALNRDAEDLITVLHETLSLSRFGELDLVSILDWSTIAAGRSLGSINARRTRSPGLQTDRARTYNDRPRIGPLALQALVSDMSRVVKSHPAYRSASVIIGGPDALSDAPNIRTQLAQGVATATGKDLIILRWPAWQIANGAPSQSSLERRISGSCIVVDDVWTDGATMNAIARLARASGASNAYGLASTMSHITEAQH